MGSATAYSQKMPLDNFEMFLSILSLVYSLLFQGGSFSLGQSKPVLAGKTYGDATASKRRERACTWQCGAGSAPGVGGTPKGMARSHEGSMPRRAWPKRFSRLRRSEFYSSWELGQSRVLGVAATTGSSGGTILIAPAPGAGSAPGSRCPASPRGAGLSHTAAAGSAAHMPSLQGFVARK